MKRHSPVDPAPEAAAAPLAPKVVPADARPPSRLQRKFNKIVEQLTQQRGELQRWQLFREHYQRKLAADYQPLAKRLRERRIAMVTLLDRAMDGRELGKRERDKVREILRQMLAELLGETEDAELIRIHDKYADVGYHESKLGRLDEMRSLASEEFGIDVDAYDGAEDPDELAQWLKERLRGVAAEGEPGAENEAPTGARAKKREAARAAVAEGGTRAVRNAFRKLASELHPDRESDPAERARKTELMKEVNQAYKDANLLALLELQLRLEQLDTSSFAGLAEEQLRHYIHVLEEQSRGMAEEIDELIQPFTVAFGGSAPRKLTPDIVQRALETDIRHLKGVLREVEDDLKSLQDIRVLKGSLERVRVDVLEDDEPWDAYEGRRRPRGGRRA
jgi:hypothetical protein